MERNYGEEIDALRKEIEELKNLITGTVSFCMENQSKQQEKESKKNRSSVRKTVVQKMKQMHPDPSVMEIMHQMEDSCGTDGEKGRITYMGVFASGGRQSKWIRNNVSTNELLPLIENRTAEQVLSCIGNNDRLNILLAILKKPMTVAQLIEECGYHSTGQVYHHLKPLIAADLITVDNRKGEKGYYVIQPYRVQGILMLLAGIHDMVDARHKQGDWSEETADSEE